MHLNETTTMTPTCKLLLVEDSEDDVFLLKRALSRHPGFRVVGWAEDGNAAIDYLNGSGRYSDRTAYPWPDLMILDLKMPGRSGHEVLQWMQGKSPRPKVAVFTTSDLEDDKDRVRQLGVDLYQQKAFQEEALALFIKRLEGICHSKD
jgi:DNA-binding response OmpR family regulator